MLNFIRFYSYGSSSLNLDEPKYLVGNMPMLKNDSTVFEIEKSALQGKSLCDVELWWFSENVKNENCTTETNKLIEKAGEINCHEAEKYANIVLNIKSNEIGNELKNTAFAISNGSNILYEYDSSDGSIAELIEQLNEYGSILKIEAIGNSITIKLCRDYCDVDFEIVANPNSKKSIPIGIIKKRCVCSKSYVIKANSPLKDGCYSLAIVEKKTNAIISISNTFQVSDKFKDTVVIEFEGEAFDVQVNNLRQMFRINGDFNAMPDLISTSERTLTNGKRVRGTTQIHKKHRLFLHNTHQFHVDLERILMQEKVFINGVEVFMTEHKQSDEINNGKISGTYIFLEQAGILTNSKKCDDYFSAKGVVKIIDEVSANYWIEADNGQIIESNFEQIQLTDNEYCVYICNDKKYDITAEIYVGGIKKKELIIGAKKKGKINISLCDCKEVTIKIKQ